MASDIRKNGEHNHQIPKKVTVVLGAQWGDEGKGKVVDVLAAHADLVCRCQKCGVVSPKPNHPTSPHRFPISPMLNLGYRKMDLLNTSSEATEEEKAVVYRSMAMIPGLSKIVLFEDGSRKDQWEHLPILQDL
ncbi:hypothetical protein J6590_105012 [Homalodisca vitripennis]|nr:hypothetical protein J6590_105012 [Homalodisca vitripennis]